MCPIRYTFSGRSDRSLLHPASTNDYPAYCLQHKALSIVQHPELDLILLFSWLCIVLAAGFKWTGFFALFLARPGPVRSAAEWYQLLLISISTSGEGLASWIACTCWLWGKGHCASITYTSWGHHRLHAHGGVRKLCAIDGECAGMAMEAGRNAGDLSSSQVPSWKPNLSQACGQGSDWSMCARHRRELHLICDNLWEEHRQTPIAIGLGQLWEAFQRGRRFTQRLRWMQRRLDGEHQHLVRPNYNYIMKWLPKK